MGLRVESLAPRVIVALVTLITITSFTVSGSLMLRERESRMRALESSVRTAADYAATALAYPIWNVSYREMDVLLRWIFREESVYAVVLSIPDMQAEPISYVRNAERRESTGVPEIRKDGRRELRSLLFEGRRIGELEIHYTGEYVSSALRAEMVQSAAMVFILDVILASVLYIILRRTIFGPLARMERWADALERGEQDPDAVLGAEGRGEIKSLRKSITGMVDMIRSRERDYRSLFESSPVSLWELDFSALKRGVTAALDSGRPMHELPLLRDPNRTRSAIRSVKVRAVNDISLRWLGISSLDEMPGGVGELLMEDALGLTARELGSLVAKEQGVEGECGLKLPSGEIRRYMVRFATLAGYEDDWSRVILSAVDISGRAAAEAKLVAALSEKEELVKELFHRTRNSLQLVSSLISLREPYAESSGTSELRSLRSRIETIVLAQDQLYGEQDLSILDLSALLGSIVDTVSQEQAVSTVRKNMDMEMVPATIDRAVPMGMILFELVSNAYRHAFSGQRNGALFVRLGFNAAGTLELSVQDDGPGFPKGFDPKKDGRFGLNLVYALGEGQLGGTLSFHCEGGLRWILRVSDTDPGAAVRV